MHELTVTAQLTGNKAGMAISCSASGIINIETTLRTLHHTLQTVVAQKAALEIGDTNPAKSVVMLIVNRGEHLVNVWNVTQDDPNFEMYPGESVGPVRVAPGQISTWKAGSTLGSTVEVCLAEAGDPNA